MSEINTYHHHNHPHHPCSHRHHQHHIQQQHHHFMTAFLVGTSWIIGQDSANWRNTFRSNTPYFALLLWLDALFYRLYWVYFFHISSIIDTVIPSGSQILLTNYIIVVQFNNQSYNVLEAFMWHQHC